MVSRIAAVLGAFLGIVVIGVFTDKPLTVEQMLLLVILAVLIVSD